MNTPTNFASYARDFFRVNEWRRWRRFLLGYLALILMIIGWTILASQPAGLRMMSRAYWVSLANEEVLLWFATLIVSTFAGYVRGREWSTVPGGAG